MLETPSQIRQMIVRIIKEKNEQGHATDGLAERLESVPDRIDELLAFADGLTSLPLRDDWPHDEPNDWDSIVAQMAPDRYDSVIRPIEEKDAAARIESAFLGSVCGCVLGKPLEINPTLAELRDAFETIGEWPISRYVSERVRTEGGLRKLHESWTQTVRERIAWVAPDDDINYTVMGMLVLEKYGASFTQDNLRDEWFHQLAPGWTWGPERTLLVRAAADTLTESTKNLDRWGNTLNPGDELCGAMIRADAYGYACPGNPQHAAELAWRDASWTHRRSGIYGTMFAAAAIATAMVTDDPIDIVETAVKYIPQRSRFADVIYEAIAVVKNADDWMEAYEAIHAKYGAYSHCRVFQESATLVNTLRFAKNVGHGICLQVMQGNDTDSYGATAGSILGAYFGPGHLEDHWLAPFNNTIHTTLADFHVQNLAVLAKRMGELPQWVMSSCG